MGLKDVPQVAELSPSRAVSVVAPTALDGRRRPGRPEQVNPHLIPLLRDPAIAETSTPLRNADEVESFNKGLSAARGIGFGLLLAVPAWTAIGLVRWVMLR